MFGKTISVFGAAFMATSMFVAPALADYPERPIAIIVPYGAGGGTDAIARIIAVGLERELGQSISVVNRDGGSGLVGHVAIAQAEPDGYTIGFGATDLNMMHWLGRTELTWADYTPLALMNEDPAGLQVLASSEYETVGELIDAIRSAPAGTFKGSGTGVGGIWHLALAGLLHDQGIDPANVPWVPNNGAAPALQDLMAGGVDIVPSSVVEARGLIEAGRVKSLAVMSTQRNDLVPDVPTLEEAIGSSWQIGVWRGILAPKGLQEDVAARLIEALQAVYESDEYKQFMAAQGFGLRWAGGDEFADFLEETDVSLGQTMRIIGLIQ